MTTPKTFRSPRRETGFTLIELLTVLVIIGILAAIAVPIYSSQKRQAQDAKTRSDVKTIALAVEDWYQDNSNAQLHRGSFISENVHNLAIHTDKPGSTSFPGTSSTGKETLLTNFALPAVSDGTRWAWKAKPLSTYGTTTNTAPGADPTQWTFSPGEEYRWCIVAANSAGNYNFDNGGNFSKMLFWDSTAPGVKTRAELPVDGACKQYR